MKPVVYLADLRHNYGGVLSADCMPLAVGYMKAVMDAYVPDIESRIFAYPDRLLKAMDERPPDVLMVGNYVWNEALSVHMLKAGKRRNPNMLAVMGGPNIPNEPDRRFDFVARRPAIDLYIVNEADFVAAEVVRQFIDAGMSLERFREREITSCITRKPDGELVFGGSVDRRRELDEIPSPWLTGIMDEFFDGKLAPMIETNRGCPFRCSFCVQGTGYYNPVTNFSLERLAEEIYYIADRIHEKSPSMGTLRIADANYGMYDRDLTISGYIAEMQKKYRWPTFIDATTGKNKPEKIIKSMEKLNGALVLYQAVQSLDEDVLKHVRRSNIKLESYEKIQVHIRGRGLRANSDLILGLPGESYKSHTDALFKMVDAGTDQMHCFQAMMLKGSDLEMVEAREKYKFDTRFRVLPKNYGVYDDDLVFDIEEIIVATDTLPFEDYIECRKLHMTFSVFWNDGWFSDLIEFAHRHGVPRSEWLKAMLDAMMAEKGKVREFLDAFVGETKNELFPTREACIAHYSEPTNFERLRNGEIGDNLMYKYRAIASFHLWPEICAIAMNATRLLLEDRGLTGEFADFDEFWADLHRYCEAKHAHGRTIEDVLAPVVMPLQYDIPRWFADGAHANTRAYRLPEPTTFTFQLSQEGYEELRSAFDVWGDKVKGLAKMVTRVRVSAQVRECTSPMLSASRVA